MYNTYHPSLSGIVPTQRALTLASSDSIQFSGNKIIAYTPTLVSDVEGEDEEEEDVKEEVLSSARQMHELVMHDSD